MKTINRFLNYSFITALIIVIFITVIDFISFDIDFYKKEYKKLNINETINIENEALYDITIHLLNYIKDKNDNLMIKAYINNQERTVFNEKEIKHMIDVKKLYLSTISVRNFLLIFIFFNMLLNYFLNEYISLNALSISYINTLKFLSVFISVVALYAYLDFYNFWVNFHYLFFENELFFLDPNTDILIMMVPQQFFIDLIFRILMLFIIIILLLLVLAFYLKGDRHDKYRLI